MRLTSLSVLVLLLGACAPGQSDQGQVDAVQTSGKSDVEVADVPSAVLVAAKAELPELEVTSAESETRDGRRYFDLGGTAGGQEVELDIMEENGRWRVVETQRDIRFESAPQPVRAAAEAHPGAFEPTRVIESKQQDKIIIYELFAPAGNDPQGRKLEVKWDGRVAAVLTKEWAH